MKKERYCHICKVPTHGSAHWKLHANIDKKQLKYDYLCYNFPLLLNKEKIINLYEVEKYSLPMLCEYVGGLDLKSMQFILNYYNVKCRTISEALKTPESRRRTEESCLKKFGAINPLSKGTEPFKKRNKTVLDKYGVENVFQILSEFADEFHHVSRSKISSLNMMIASRLKQLNIKFKQEYVVKYKNANNKNNSKFYDFYLEEYNLLLEINGDYWHANPNKYNANAIFYFPKSTLTAQEIWNMDAFKKEIAIVNNYKIAYIWECEIKKKSNEEIDEIIKNCINKANKEATSAL